MSLAVVLGAAGLGLWRFLASDEDAGPGPATAASETAEASPLDSAPPGSSASPAAPTFVSCSSLTAGYSLAYPAEWFTAANKPSQECRYFDEQPFVLAADPQSTEVAVFTVSSRVDYQDWVDSYEQEGIEIIDRFETTAGGARATATEFVFTDDPLGAINYAYDIEYDGVLTLFAVSTYSDDFEATKQIVDAMAASLEFL